MKKNIVFIIFVLSLGLQADAGVTVLPFGGSGGSGGGVSYVFEENFETPTTGWENTWSSDGDSPDPVYTTTVLRGTQSLKLERTVDSPYVDADFSSGSEFWGHFLFRFDSLSGYQCLYLRDSSDNVLAYIQIEPDDEVGIAHGSVTASSTSTVSTNTTYHFWWHYKENSGSTDGEFEVWVGTTTARPGTSYVSISNGDGGSGDASNLRLRSNNTGVVRIFDQIIVDDSSLTSVDS